MNHLDQLLLDPERDVPLYRQVVDHVLGLVRSGALPPGYRLPPTRDLARTLGTHRGTVVRAYEELSARGGVISVVGRGTFVAAGGRAARPARSPVTPTHAAPLPWDSLFARRLDAEPLHRVARLSREATPLDTIDLAGLSPPEELLPHDRLRRCIDHVLKDQGARVLGYAPGGGVPRLRARIAADLTRSGVPAEPDEVLITTGSQQALDLVARALVDPGDPFLTEELTYAGTIQLFTAAGARLAGVPCDAEGPVLGDPLQMGHGRPKGFYVMPNHRNPTGQSIAARRREELVAWSRRHGVPLIEDDYDADLLLDDQPVPASLRALDPDVLHVGTFSKKLIPALRVGFIVAPKPVRDRLERLKRDQDLGTSSLLQHALAEFLERGYLEAHLRKTLREYRARRSALEAALSGALPADVTWSHAARGLFLWLALPPGLTSEAVYEEARRRGVLVSPSVLHRVGTRAPEGLRITFCRETPHRLAEGARRLAEAIEAVAGRPGEGAGDRLGPRLGPV